MSRDIRSFFSGASTKKTVAEKDEPKEFVVKKRKKKVIESDSDDEVQLVTQKKAKPQEVKKQCPKSDAIEDISSIFGSKPAKRSSLTTKKDVSPKKSKNEGENGLNTKMQKGKIESEVHSDDDFIATLDQIDKLEKKYSPAAKNSKKTNFAEEKSLGDKKRCAEKGEPQKPAKISKLLGKNEDEPKEKNPKVKEKSKEKTKSPECKAKLSKAEPNDAALEEAWDKRKQHAESYRKFLQRKGPAHMGEKEIPEGAKNCLQGLTFVVTGVLDSLDREGASELVQKYGGKVTSSVSKNTSYLVVGEDAGPSKLEKAKNFNIPNIDEDGLLDLIRTRPTPTLTLAKTGKQTTPGGRKIKKEDPPKQKTPVKKEEDKMLQTVKKNSQASSSGSQAMNMGSQQSTSSYGSQATLPPSPVISAGDQAMWVDKYKPQSVRQIIGQQTDRSIAKKLTQWLLDWNKNHSNPNEKKPRPAPWAKNDNGSAFKAALLSGPPGIGKTTTIQLVCKELGFDIVEFNASDTRSKKLLQQEVSEMLSTQSLTGMFHGNKKEAMSKKRVLLMEEVDGMAGNQDRGGIAELIMLIKKAKVPVICTCNDRGSQKIRSLVNYCFDLRFQKPKLEQIRAALMTICFKEKVNIPKDALDAMIVGTNYDIRQIIHMMSVWAAGQTKVDTGLMEKESKKSKKEFKLGIWDVTPKVFSAELSGNTKNAIYDKTNLFFQDYSLGPLFVQENYLSAVHGVEGGANMKKKLELMSKASDSLAKGDLVENLIRVNQAWGLLPVQAIYSTVVPGIVLRGRLTSQAMFPSWLGKNSRKNKFDRLASELQLHMRLSITGSKSSVQLDYLNALQDRIFTSMNERGSDGVAEAIDAMVGYNLIRDDLDKLAELSTWGSNSLSPWQQIEGKVKAQLTREYNKMPIMTPFAMQSVSSKKGGVGAADIDDLYGLDEEDAVVYESDDEEDNDAGKDSMIKAKKPSAKAESKGKSTKGRSATTAAKRSKK
ncbi:replication factor C subunit 1 [Neocloeon triangulifer]|uniref:replication factor C subunit 1 n=1 Tax=Neocloeon triangulifer TaxID=2078957 RepID=UPI00286F1992|nr:replication factor C subunit 1 [Neocloeon triangulifer]